MVSLEKVQIEIEIVQAGEGMNEHFVAVEWRWEHAEKR